MLYTVVPLERIYSYRPNSVIISSYKNPDDQNGESEYKDISIQHGRISARRDGENYVVDRICSTDMSDYLNVNYMPGSIIK